MWIARLPEHRLPAQRDVFARITSDLPSPASTLRPTELTVIRRVGSTIKRSTKKRYFGVKGLTRLSLLSAPVVEMR